VQQAKLVSVGLATYNGARFLPDTLDSLLGQTFHEFELIISDNASDDDTQEICLDYADRDPRISYFRNDQNLGAPANFNRAFERSSSKYFMWASDHDLWDPKFMEEGVQALNSEPSAVLWYPQTVLIDRDHNALDLIDPRFDTRGESPASRFHRFIRTDFRIHTPIYGLIVASALRRTHLIQRVYGPDMVCLAELTRLGAFVRTPHPLFYLRLRRQSMSLAQHQRRVMRDLDPSGRAGIRRAYLLHLYRLFVISQHGAHLRDRITQGFDVISLGTGAMLRDLKRTLHLAPEPEPVLG
jgi:glycosyltransferase involved in cell wall biosynthesis